MSLRALHALVLTAGVCLLACSDQPEAGPTEPQFAPTARCDFRTVRSNVRDYFTLADEKTVLGIVDLMEAACTGTQPAAQTGYGYDVMAQLARVRNGGSQEPRTGRPSVAAALLTGLFQKMPGVQVPAGTDFLPAVQVGGALGVRGGASDANRTAVLSLGSTADFTSMWGIEPPSASSGSGQPKVYTSDFKTMTTSPLKPDGVRFLVFGSPAASFTDLISQRSSYGIHTIPAVTFNPEAIVGTCAATVAASRVEHQFSSGTSAVLALREPLFCGSSTGLLGQEQPATFAHRLLRVLLPPPLSATVALLRGGGGGISTLSDFELVEADTITLSYLVQPNDARALKTVSLTVQAVAGGPATSPKVPVEGVQIALDVVGNQGSFIVDPAIPTATTGEDGKATITFTLDKAGGYTVQSAAALDGYLMAPITSLI